MIYFRSIRNASPYEFDSVWAIVRSFKNPSKNIIHVPTLSPNWDLFKKYLKLKEDGNWNDYTFSTIYEPEFRHQIDNDPEAQRLLDVLCRLDSEGKNIALVCFCPDWRLCHRKIIAEMLSKRGCQVNLK